MAPEPTLRRNPDVVFRAIEGGGVLLNTASGAYHEVNSTAAEIWDALETPSTQPALLKEMRDRFGDVPELDTDVVEFIGMLTERGLVVTSDPQ